MAKNTWLIILVSIIIASVILLIVVADYDRRDIDDDEFDERNFPAIRVVVHNGCGFMGVANNVRRHLFDKNIDVVGVGNTRRFIYDETLIVVKHNDEVDLRRLQRMTGIENVIYAVNENYFVPFIIIAGRDYQRFFD